MTLHALKSRALLALAIALAVAAPCQAAAKLDTAKMNKYVDQLLAKMTLEEKIGQLNLGAAGNPKVVNSTYGMDEAARRGLVSATGGADYNLQKIAVEQSRLGIPILFGLDVIHGYATTFPIPLAQSTSWDLPLIERAAQIAAKEATSQGISWTWSPMVDICRDARWGRIAEGAGEDPYLGSLIAQAMVRGYQGDNLASDTTLLACFKHFALYGASESGRDYNTVDMSRWMMYNYFFPPYKAAVDAGCETGMTSFNVIDGVPATGNKWLLNDVLRQQWGFKGFLVSDANSLGEMETHRVGNDMDVSQMAIEAGMDMDMGSRHYNNCIARLVDEGRVSVRQINAMVRRILVAKYKLGLFDDPYRYVKLLTNKKRQSCMLSDEHVAFARKFAAECIVLLKNSEGLLPLNPSYKNIALVGPINDAKMIVGTWSTKPDYSKSRNVDQALRQAVGSQCKVSYYKGCNLYEGLLDADPDDYVPHTPDATDSLIAEAVNGTRDADVILALVGEDCGWSGEAHSRATLTLPESQRRMLKALKGTGKPVALVVFGGRPLQLTNEDKNFSTILYAWDGGTSAADALADVLTGKVNPSAKLTTTFPHYVGQEPYYYNHLNTGRPMGEFWATTKYFGLPLSLNTPLYPFGYGLSYNTYEYSDIRASKTLAQGDADSITVSVDVTNRGTREGKEIVQLYISDLLASTSRPVEELKGFEKVSFKPGETKTVSFTITPEALKFYNSQLNYDWEAGDFNLSIGPNSRDLKTVKVTWQK